MRLTRRNIYKIPADIMIIRKCQKVGNIIPAGIMIKEIPEV